ncbi:MAG: cysteine--tRNA ligase [Bacilli bacterium]|nr:cysteine--tRNA ligase [Bacilli bacterium]
MKLYNTLSRKIEDFIPNEEGKVKFYTCGPTVYSDAHIGNIRSYIGHDILDKTLRYIGYDVTRIMNITDVGHLTSDSDYGDDKMVESAKKENKNVMDIAGYYTDRFFIDFDLVNNKVPEIVSPATSHIDDYIKIITKLIEKGYAYESGGNIYFDTSKLTEYYQLTNHKEEEMLIGAREGVDKDSNKKNQADFVLWFTKSKFDSQELKWESPWGMGYPGWHIECSGICIHHGGEYIDIHGGGVDNIFPHHTNEIAQSEAYLGHKWCNYWFHNEHLMDETGKMSKSDGATLTVSKLKEKGYDPLSYRFMCLNSHYRKQLVFNYTISNSSEQTYKKLKNRISLIKDDGELDEDAFAFYNKKFITHLEADLNTANAMTLIYDLLKNELINGHTKLELIKSFDKVLSLDLLKKEELREDHDDIIALIKSRNNAKKRKDFELADSIRDELSEKGIVLLDTREGTTYKVVGE